MSSSRETLTPTQKIVKRPGKCRYAGEDKNVEPEVARWIITLYLTCRLGYTPIKHILGLANDKVIENVVRQHGLGRSQVRHDIGELKCKGDKHIQDWYMPVIIEAMTEFGTRNNAYNEKMITTRTWNDESRGQDKFCRNCGKELKPEWIRCPYCSSGHSTKKLF